MIDENLSIYTWLYFSYFRIKVLTVTKKKVFRQHTTAAV